MRKLVRILKHLWNTYSRRFRFKIIEVSDRPPVVQNQRNDALSVALSEAIHLSNIVWSWGKCPRRRAGRYLRVYSWARRKPSETRALYIRLAPVIIPLQNLRWQCGGGAPASVCTGDARVSGRLMECHLVFGRLARALTRNPRSRLRAEYQNQLLDYSANLLTNLGPARAMIKFSMFTWSRPIGFVLESQRFVARLLPARCIEKLNTHWFSPFARAF